MPHFIVPTAKTALILAALLTLASTAGVEAKPKRLTNGCTDAQIQSASAGQCIDKMQDDIMHNRPTYHALYCSSTGKMLCCQYDQAGNTVDHSCDIISTRANPQIFTPGFTHDLQVQSLGSSPGDGSAQMPPSDGTLY
ncbi:MAG: hypothetical protein ACTHLT_03285 [Devosia sp.]